MIKVLADDLTGAAELAGMAMQHGLETKLSMQPHAISTADAIVYCSDSRSHRLPAALALTETFLRAMDPSTKDIFYKKTDSVLRGHVVEELVLQMKLLGFQRVLFIPCNPSMGRIIWDGKYCINNELLSDTSFANDPEFPQHSAMVFEGLSGKGMDIHVLKPDQNLPETGIIVGEASRIEDLVQWVSRIDETMMLAGGGDFFQALLDQQFGNPVSEQLLQLKSPFLYVSGTTFQSAQSMIRSFAQVPDLVHSIGMAELSGVGLDAWVGRLLHNLERNQMAIIAFDQELTSNPNLSALELRQKMAGIVRSCMDAMSAGEMFIEGGSTAQAIMQALDIPYWIPDTLIGRGVVRLTNPTDQYHVTVKPGSYPLPGAIKKMLFSTLQ